MTGIGFGILYGLVTSGAAVRYYDYGDGMFSACVKGMLWPALIGYALVKYAVPK